ncbi:hypothetical protein [Pelagibius sp. Alg239-R121]|uniref:hypothetical protein n=1 Tax=Pelagibius sp. Alg239-R121 TaxID=2993448 RepID=UPI0024A6C09D|nr:hypothetical protein [Pelagibius sp. Alg239-R121]
MQQNSSSTFSKSVKSVGAAALMTAAFAGHAAAESNGRAQGLLLLHAKEQIAVMEDVLPKLARQGCTLWQRGSLVGAQGNLDIGSPGRFVLLDCSEPVLSGAESYAALAPLFDADESLRAVEGPLLFRTADEASDDKHVERDYVLKISHYNNRDPKARNEDLEQINSIAGGRKNTWKTEGFIAGLRAVGMPTPDEVVVIHYDNPQQGEDFRNSNPDILKQIGTFNEQHLTEFTYLSAAPDR